MCRISNLSNIQRSGFEENTFMRIFFTSEQNLEFLPLNLFSEMVWPFLVAFSMQYLPHTGCQQGKFLPEFLRTGNIATFWKESSDMGNVSQVLALTLLPKLPGCVLPFVLCDVNTFYNLGYLLLQITSLSSLRRTASPKHLQIKTDCWKPHSFTMIGLRPSLFIIQLLTSWGAHASQFQDLLQVWKEKPLIIKGKIFQWLTFVSSFGALKEKSH